MATDNTPTPGAADAPHFPLDVDALRRTSKDNLLRVIEALEVRLAESTDEVNTRLQRLVEVSARLARAEARIHELERELVAAEVKRELDGVERDAIRREAEREITAIAIERAWQRGAIGSPGTAGGIDEEDC